MAQKMIELEACKAAAVENRVQLRNATTKDQAIASAIDAATNLLKAIRLSSDVEERKQWKVECNTYLNLAQQLKDKDGKAQNLSTQNSIQRSVHAAMSQPDTATAPADNRSTLKEPSQTCTSSTPGDLELTNIPAQATHQVTHVQSKSNVPDSEYPNHNNPNVVRDQCIAYDLIDLADPPPLLDKASVDTEVQEEQGNRGVASFVSTAVPTDEIPSITISRKGTTALYPGTPSSTNSEPLAPRTASYSCIHRLIEPVSTRKRSNREDIILLKSSVVNGFKCPPLDGNPITAADFAVHNGAQLFVDAHDLSLSPYQQQYFRGWVRARDAIPPPSMVSGSREGVIPSMSSSTPIDLVQDAASDCSVVASLCAAIARAERGHDEMLSNKLYPFDSHLGRPIPSNNGKYAVRLNFNGCWRKVVIDDRLPVSNTHRLLHVVDRRNPSLLWPALLEKAYLKVRGGYDFPGSNSCSDLWTFTGWIPEQVFLQENDTVPGQLWNRIYNAFSYGDVLVTAGTGKMSSRQERELGLEGQHSYVVLDMLETAQDRLLLVKNPWVEGKGWKGPRPANTASPSTSLTGSASSGGLEVYHQDSIPTEKRPHPTTFWISLEQVIRYFESLYLNWNPGLFRHRQDIHFEWQLDPEKSPGGCIISHPQFSFLAKNSEVVWFLLNRHFRDTPAGTKEESDTFNDGSIQPELQVNSAGEHTKGYMSIYVCTGHGDRLYIKDTYLESSDYVTTPQCLLRWEADANETYTVVVDQDELPVSLYTFSLSAFSNSSIKLEPATQKYPLQKVEQSSWTRHTAGGSTSSARYFENPQYSLEMKEHGSLAILLTSADHEHPMHVKLALGYGKRIYRLQSRDVLADSGDHRTSCVFAETKDLQPGLYTIICSLFEAGQTGDYKLRVDSTSDIVLKQIPRDGAGLVSMKLSPACFGANVNKIAAPLMTRRLASYTIVAHFVKATTPRSADLSMLARSPFRLSVELGRGPERKFLIASERGEYTDAMTIRSESVSIDPAFGSRGELWLVLDRLSGPGGPIEEWYDVVIYTDIPQACTLGVWREW